MPKRMHCPYCDRLFSKDRIDDHIRVCRNRSQRSNTRRSRISRELVVDGNNIAYYLAPDGKPKVRNLILAHRSLQNTGYIPIIVVSAALKYKIDRPEVLREMIETGHVIETARGQNDDLVIIKMARDRKLSIVTNDRFLDWLDRFPWLPTVIKRYRMTPSGIILI